jgi:restriction system protein
MDTRKLWAVRAGNSGQADTLFIDKGQVAISSSDIDDDVSTLPPSRRAFREIVARMTGTANPESVPIRAGQLYRFVHEMRIGDHIIYPRKCDRTLHLGIISGPYVYDSEGNASFAHRRAVSWQRALSRDLFTQGALYELGSALTLFEISSFAEEIRMRFAECPSKPRDAGNSDESEDIVLRDIHESTNDFIAKKLRTDFKGVPLEPLVAELFRAMGYRAHATRAVRDDGIDVIAHKDELGIEPPIVKIQVKTNDANISAETVKAFYAMVHERDVGIFITTGGFTGPARDFARSKGNLKLMNGVELIDLIQKFYDNLALKYRQQIPLRRVLVPDTELSYA